MKLNELSSEYGIDAKLLKRYFLAFSNLYGICSLQKAMEIFNQQNPEHPVRNDQILGFAENYSGDWKIILPNEVYSNIPASTPMRHEIVNKMLVYYNDYGGYDYVRSHQADKDFYVPCKDELLKYAREEYYEETPYTIELAQLLKDKLHIADWQKKMLEIVLNLHLDNYDIQGFIDSLGQAFPNIDVSQDAITCYNNLHNNTRLMVNRGHTPWELARKSNPQGALPTSISFGPGIQRLIQSGEIDAAELIKGFAAMDLPQDLRQNLIAETKEAKQPKPNRNDSCPCGSGKKYKKCCGR